ncbi:hypothetical protein O206_21720 [Ochrobactrum sp. EGD-AQ16]|nr:hypothetical protein O206_21720 [Ochrobactrum sp. EGD-AQ16]
MNLNRLCGSGLQAVVSIVLAGGAESMSRSCHLLTQARNGQKMGDVTAIDRWWALTDPFGHGHMG